MGLRRQENSCAGPGSAQIKQVPPEVDKKVPQKADKKVPQKADNKRGPEVLPKANDRKDKKTKTSAAAS